MTGQCKDMREGIRLGKYRLIKPLGQGGEGSVWLAEDESLLRMAALKHLWDGDEARIRNEAAFLRDLRHPMLPVVYDLFRAGGSVAGRVFLQNGCDGTDGERVVEPAGDGWFLAMEYIDGISLHKYIEDKGRVEEEQARLWAASLLDVLSYLHTRKTPVIYRDLKPDNIIVCRDGDIRLVDFGAAVFRSFGEGRDGGTAYTEGYAAPEQKGMAGGRAYADERSDIYAFGKILYYIVTGADPGVPPFTALPAFLYNPLLSGELERVIERCICVKPEERYQVVGEVLADLTGKTRRKGGRRGHFIRHVEKQVYLTQKEGYGLLGGG